MTKDTGLNDLKSSLTSEELMPLADQASKKKILLPLEQELFSAGLTLVEHRISLSENKEQPDLPLTQPGAHSRFLDGWLDLLDDRWQFLQAGDSLTTIF